MTFFWHRGYIYKNEPARICIFVWRYCVSSNNNNKNNRTYLNNPLQAYFLRNERVKSLGVVALSERILDRPPGRWGDKTQCWRDGRGDRIVRWDDQGMDIDENGSSTCYGRLCHLMQLSIRYDLFCMFYVCIRFSRRGRSTFWWVSRSPWFRIKKEYLYSN